MSLKAYIDLNHYELLPLEDLHALQSQLAGLVQNRLDERKKEALEQIRVIVKEHELTFDEVVAAVRTASKRGKAPPIYRNAANPRQTWSGVGDAPAWYSNHPDPESLRIPGA